ncbi:MAG: hypothetical protein IKT30_09045, partial [Bacteroidaceae bacterium]|nr:hypothetical protein [Bacteroidaceae bacterium]
MESKELRGLINRHLFVPISEELVERLKDVVDTQVSEMTAETVTKYAKAVFKNQVDWTFKNAIQTKYKEQYGESLTMPNIVFLILEGYTLRLMILSEAIDVNIKAKSSLIIRNCAITRKGHWDGIVCSKWLIDIYNYYGEYSKQKVISNVAYGNLLKTVTPKTQWVETGLEITEKAVYDQIRSLCASGVRGKLSWYIGSLEFKYISSPYVKAYLLAKKMVREWNWKYISENPVEKFFDALGEKAKKRKQLGKIVDEV